MRVLLKWRPWMKWGLLGVLLLSVTTYGFCYFLESYDPNYPWSGDLGRSMKAKGILVSKFQKDGAWRHHVTILANQSPPVRLEWNEIEAIASLQRIDGLDIHGPGGPWVTSLLSAVRELEGTKSVRLNQVRLDDPGAEVLSKFESLTDLSLESVPNGGRILARLNNPALVNLWLSNTIVQDADLVGMSASLPLESLYIDGGQFLAGESFAKIAAIKTLKQLRLRHVGVDGDALTYFKDHPALETLWLSNTLVSGRDLREIARNKALKALYVEGPMSANAALKAIGAAENLETLILQNTVGTEQGLAYLKGAKNLKVLEVNVPVSEVGLRHLAELPNLTELRAMVRINRAVIRELATFKNLTILDPVLPFPQADTDLGRELRAANPRLSVSTGQWPHRS